MSVQYCITLIHGTRLCSRRPLPKNHWTRPEGWLRRTIELNFERTLGFPPKAIAWCLHDWSGQNSHAARVAAAKELETRLHSQLKQYPEASHVIIAHSHGGNVALLALRDADLQRRIDRIITLNTPFLRGAVRSLTSITVGLPALLLPLVMFMLFPLLLALSLGEPHWWHVIALLLSSIVGIGGITLLAKQFNIRSRIERVRTITRGVYLPKIENTPISCLSSASDEVDDLFQFLDAVTSAALAMLRIKVILVAWLLLTGVHEVAYYYWDYNLSFFERTHFPMIEQILVHPQRFPQELSLRLPLWFVSSSFWLFAGLIGVQGLSWLHLRYLLGVKGIGFSDAIYVRLVTDAIPVTARNVEFKEFDVTEVEQLNHNVSHANDAVLREIWLLLTQRETLRSSFKPAYTCHDQRGNGPHG